LGAYGPCKTDIADLGVWLWQLHEVRFTMNEESGGVHELCSALEQACFHGIKSQEFHGMLPFWDMVDLLASVDGAQGCPQLAATVAAVKALPGPPVTGLGKARSFLRVALREGTVRMMGKMGMVPA
jgi:hypothetical protein